jgi:hypothetical protein
MGIALFGQCPHGKSSSHTTCLTGPALVFFFFLFEFVRTVQNDDFSQAWPRQIDLSPSFCFRPTGPTTVLIPAHETCSEKEKKRPLSHATILFIRKIKCSGLKKENKMF